MTKPTLPKTLNIHDLDTSYEFAHVNFPGWWEEMRERFGYNELDLIRYVTQLRTDLLSSHSPLHSRDTNLIGGVTA